METLQCKANNNKSISSNKKPLFDINNSNNLIENEYCPHILNHFLNPFLNSILTKISLPSIPQKDQKNSKKQALEIYFQNISLFQNSYKSHIYYGYPQHINLFDKFLFKNLSLNHLLYSNPQNLPINSLNKEANCVFSLNFNDTGDLMSASNPINMELWGVPQKKIKKIFSDHKEVVTDVAFFHGEKDCYNFLSCSLDKTIKLYKDFKNIVTFNEHNDWVRALAISYDNTQFLSGCVSSIVKLWDLNKKIVIGNINNQTDDNSNFMNTVNSLKFFDSNHNIFMIGFRSSDIKICDERIRGNNNNIAVVQTFKAHNQKLNTAKINKSEKYILTSGRDSSVRLWDFRKLPKKEEKTKYEFINEYNKHICTGYNVECNFYDNENYIMTGSETGSIFIYDVMNSSKYKEIKTHLKCINLIKEIPNQINSFAFVGLAESAIFICNSEKNISKFYEKEENSNSEEDKYNLDDEDEIEDKNQEICSSIVEDIMKDYGDIILKNFHKNNMTSNNGVNFVNMLEIVQNAGGEGMSQFTTNFFNRIMKKFEDYDKKNTKDQKKEKMKAAKNNVVQKREINCIECDMKNNMNNIINEEKDNDNNIFNCVDKEVLKQLLILPNNFEFNVFSEI